MNDEWFNPRRFALLLAALIFASFPQVVLGLQTFVVRDYGFFAYPLAYFQKECFWRGELPLWNPYNNCGVPFLAQWNTMPLYPPSLIYLLLPLNWSLSFFCLLHLFWGGLGMFHLSRRWKGSGFAGAVAGIAFSFNGLSLNLLMWPSHIATFSWMPWVMLAVERAWVEGARKIVVAGFVGAFQMLAGGPETIAMTWLLLIGLLGFEFLVSSFEPGSGFTFHVSRFTRHASRIMFVVLLVAALSAAQLLPFLDLAAHSQREQGYADTRWSMPGWGWVNFLVPMAFGNVWSMGVFFQYDQAWTSSYYLGIGVLLLALVALCGRRRKESPFSNTGQVRDSLRRLLQDRRREWFLAATGSFALLLAFGNQTFVYRWLRHLVPQLSMVTYPIKFVTLLAFIVPLLAAYGVARLQHLSQPASVQANEGRPVTESRSITKPLLVISGLLLLLFVAVLVWAWKWPFPADNFPATLLNGLGRAGFLAANTAVLLVLVARERMRLVAALTAQADERAGNLRLVLSLLFILLLWLDVFTHAPSQNPTVSPGIYEPELARTKLEMRPQPALGQSRAMLSPTAETKFTGFVMHSPAQNYLIKRMGFFADCNLLDHVPKVNGFLSLYPRQSGELTSILYGSTNNDLPHLADFMGVSQVTAPGEFFKWRPRDSFLPLISAGQRPVFMDDATALRALTLPDFDGRRAVALPHSARQLVTVSNETQATISSPQFFNQRVEFEIEALSPSLVVLAQTYYHPWHAYVDDQPSPLLRANHAFQALEVPTGRHQVRVVYQDRAFRTGAEVSALALMGSLMVLVGTWRGRGFRIQRSGSDRSEKIDLSADRPPRAGS